MCFSAEASIVAGAACSSVGIVTLRKVKKKRFLLFASLPLLFGMQQFIEGGLWIILKDHVFEHLKHGLALVYLLFALAFWPTISPLSIYLMELNTKRKKIVFPFLCVGICLSIFLLIGFATQPFDALIKNCSIQYIYFENMPLRDELRLVYLTVAFTPFLFSQYRLVCLFGILNIGFYMIARHFYVNTYESVWCFFAAILSILIYFIFCNEIGKKEA